MALTWLDLPLVLAGVFVLAWFWYWRKVDAIKSHGLNFIQPTFLLGNSKDHLLGKKHSSAASIDLYDAFPEDRYSVLFDMASPTILIRDLDLIKKVTIENFDHFPNHRTIADKDSDLIFGGSLFALRDNDWKEMRTSVSPAFTSSRMKRMSTLIIKAADQMRIHFQEILVEKQHCNGHPILEIDSKSTFLTYFVDVTALATFGLNVNSFKDENKAFLKKSLKFANLDFTLVLKMFGLKMMPFLMKIMKIQLLGSDIINFYKKIVNDTINYREENNIKAVDFLDLMIGIKKGTLRNKNGVSKSNSFVISDDLEENNNNNNGVNKTNWTNDDITVHATFFIIAGMDTSSSATEHLFYELAMNPDVQGKLQAEVDKAIATHDDITYDVVQGMNYLNMVVSETMRKYGLFLERICSKDFDLGPVRPGDKSYTIKKGDGIMISGFSIQRDPKFWPNPMKFDPERFSIENRHHIVPYSYIPFGVGPRICIGFRFAEMAIKMATVSIVSTFDIVRTEKTPEALEFSPTALIMKASNCHFGLKLRNADISV